MTKQRTLITITASCMAILMVVSLLIASVGMHVTGNTPVVSSFDGKINTNLMNYLDKSVIYQLPSAIRDTDSISIVVKGQESCLFDLYEANGYKGTFVDFALTQEASSQRREIEEEKNRLLAILDKAEVSYEEGASYTNILAGFEVVITAVDYLAVCTALEGKATVAVSDVYQTADYELVENEVNVYETGIFDSSNFKYDGTGMVVAVLDTGLDYYHTAFSLANFTADRGMLGLTYEEVSQLVGDTLASGYHAGLTASDVYINEKVPFQFDYADKDADVFPISSDHGTHVAGIIAGRDDVITGVAPNAQLVIMKTFSDVEATARTSWILSALDDCVTLGVDVINMSLGTSCGFSTESTKELESGVYEKIRKAGISMVCAGANSFTSTYSSEKNGNLGLTSNPDNGTVSSPGTYPGTLSVASINGAKTPYILYNGKVVYFQESNDRVNEEKDFFDDLLPEGVDSKEYEYVVVPGAGRSADYNGLDVEGKIVLVRRGSNTFEEKANAAQENKAAGLIVYNNVSGEIKMNVGDATLAVCSIRQDDGEMLAESGRGTLTISRSQTSGPFMSDFSSWGPTPDLGIKPEITAHGGSILSAVPGQGYDRISGTSMACPNMSGVTALLRQYVTTQFPALKEDPVKIAALVNQLLMSTADIVYNVNGLPYAVRKQGAGLANLEKAAATMAYLISYDAYGNEMANTKLELGDDPQKTGVYTMQFSIRNFGDKALTYDIGAYVMTEGVSETHTSHGETTVTELGYILNGAVLELRSVSGATQDGNKVTIQAGSTADISLTITLSDEDKAYLDTSFENGMYVEGFITLDACDADSVDLSVPYLAFYGDWTQAPMFDLDYFETNKDELDDAIDVEDKNLPDAYSTRPIGGVEQDFVSYLGSYYFIQNPSAKIIAADRDYIAISNQEGTVHSLRFVWAGMLRNAERVEVTITDDATGEVIFATTDVDIRKSYGDGGPIQAANIDIEFDAIERNLKNNTTYTVKLKGFMDYERDGADTNLNNEFSFPLRTDFSAPVITGCEFYTEYDKANKQQRLYAKMAIYDNHYAMSAQIGYVGQDANGYVLQTFDHYLTPVYSSFNSTTYVTYELTDYIHLIRQNSAHKNTFVVAVYDYALNYATYEIALPDDYTDFYFQEEEIVISPNEVYTLTPLTYPGTEWTELLEYHTMKSSVAVTLNNKLIGVSEGTTVLYARDPVTKQQAKITVRVVGEGHEAYKRLDKPVLEEFRLTGYLTEKAYYALDSVDREIGQTGEERKFYGNMYHLSMYPSESVTLRYLLEAYFPNDTDVVFESANKNIATVDANGTIIAKAEGYTSVTVRVMMDGKSTYYSATVSITVKDPYLTTGPSLTHYFGLGGSVRIPDSLRLTDIGQFAFSNFDYVPKGEDEEVSDENPGYTKAWYLGDNTITEVIIPEGVEKIGAYAFANLTALTRVVLPSTLVSIDYGAFLGCTNLTTVEGLEHVKFINQAAFNGCSLAGELQFTNASAIADMAFMGNKNITSISFSDKIQSIGMYAFSGCRGIRDIHIGEESVKLGRYAFENCSSLTSVTINATVLPTGVFQGCSKLTSCTIGRDVSVIGEYAFGGTGITSFGVQAGNTVFYPQAGKPYLLNKAGDTILLMAPGAKGNIVIEDASITTIGAGAFSLNTGITSVTAPSVTRVEDYAFSGCSNLKNIQFATLTHIGNYAFYGTALTQAPSFAGVDTLGAYAFGNTKLTSVEIPDGVTIGEGAFSLCGKLTSVVIGDDVTVGNNAFYLYQTEKSSDTVAGKKVYFVIFTSPLTSLTIGDNVKIEERAFFGAAGLESVTIGDGCVIGDYAFYNASSLQHMDLAHVVSIGNYAFSGDILNAYASSAHGVLATDEEGYPIYRYYAADFTNLDLSTLTHVGEGAFACETELFSVSLSDAITEIPAYCFYGTEHLTTFDFAGVTRIGEYAFTASHLEEMDLSDVTHIGAYAFYSCPDLEAVTLSPDGTHVQEYAFYGSEDLLTVVNDNHMTYVGDYAFAYTAVQTVDLTDTSYIGEHAFIKDTLSSMTVTLGDQLTDMGDNPFAMSDIPAFFRVESETFNGKEYLTNNYTYDLTETIRIIDGSIYKRVPSGWELITFAGEDTTVHVAEDTVRISAYAFAGSDVKEVVLPKELNAIGHKAFFGCSGLRLVTFTSYDAPVLEELFDYAYYASGDNIPATGNFEFYDTDGITEIVKPGLGITPFYMWNVADEPNAVFYGANFVDYIGHFAGDITMIHPSNGKNYDSFIMGMYFDTVLAGAIAADDVTQDAIDKISQIPDRVTLNDKALVEAAREAYDKIGSLEQRALVTMYVKLTQAEKRISDLEKLDNPPPVDDTPVTPEEPTDPALYVVVILSLNLAVVVAGVAAWGIASHIKKKKQKETDAQDDTKGEA